MVGNKYAKYVQTAPQPQQGQAPAKANKYSKYLQPVQSAEPDTQRGEIDAAIEQAAAAIPGGYEAWQKQGPDPERMKALGYVTDPLAQSGYAKPKAPEAPVVDSGNTNNLLSDIGRSLIAPLQANENARTIVAAPLNFGHGLGQGGQAMINNTMAVGTDAANSVFNLADPNRQQFDRPRVDVFDRNALLDEGGILHSEAGVIPRVVGQVASARVPLGKASPGGGFGHMAAKDAAAFSLTTDHMAPRLSDMISSSTPVLGPVADLLRSNENDPAIVSMMKNLGEDLSISAVTAGLMKLVDASLNVARPGAKTAGQGQDPRLDPAVAAQIRRVLANEPAAVQAPVRPAPFSGPPEPSGGSVIRRNADRIAGGAVGATVGGVGDAYADPADGEGGGNGPLNAGTGAAIGFFGPRAVASAASRGFRTAARAATAPGARAAFDERVAANAVRNALKSGGITNADEASAAFTARFGDKPASIADLTQEGVGTAAGLSRLPGRTGEAARARGEDLLQSRAGRLERDIGDTTGASPATITGDVDRMVQLAREQATPAYNALREQNPFGSFASSRLEQLRDLDILRPHLQAVDRYRDTLAATEGRVVGDFEYWDLVKRSLDDAEQAAVARNQTVPYDLDSARQAIVREVDALVPDYAAARQLGGEAPRMQEAFRQGQGLLGGRYTSEDVSRLVQGVTGQPLTAMQAGVIRSMVAKTEGPRGAMAALMAPGARQKLASVFGAEAADAMQARFAADAAIVNNAQRINPNVGSVTSQAQLSGGVGPLIADALRAVRNPAEAALAALSRSGSYSKEQRDLMGEMLLGGATEENLQRIFRGRSGPPRTGGASPPTSPPRGPANALNNPPSTTPAAPGRPLPGQTSNSPALVGGGALGAGAGFLAPANSEEERLNNVLKFGAAGAGVGAAAGLGNRLLRGGKPKGPPRASVKPAERPVPAPMAYDGPIEAYHSTPHEFDTFDMAKIGTGEGNQTYGYGLYFAENPSVAKAYDRSLGGKTMKVELNAKPDELIDFDRPLADQPKLQAALDEMAPNDAIRAQMRAMPNWQDQLQRVRTANRWTEKEMAENLRQRGFKGVAYLDAGSRQAGKGTRNFVIFDADAIKRTADTPKPPAPPATNGVGGSKLPMDEGARLERARAMGFDVDTPLYHGTAADFEAFDPKFRGSVDKMAEDAHEAFFFSTNPRIAGQYAEEAGGVAARQKVYSTPEGRKQWDNPTREGAIRVGDMIDNETPNGQNVVPVFARLKNPLIVDDVTEYESRQMKAILATARANGHDGVIFKGMSDALRKGAGTADTYAIFDPKNIRGKFAAFDPAESASPKLLAGMGGAEAVGAGAGGVAGYAMNPTDANRDGVINDADRGLNAMGGLVSGVLGTAAVRNSLKTPSGPAGVTIKTPQFDGPAKLRELLGEPSKYLPWHHNPRYKELAAKAGQSVGEAPVASIVPGQSQIRHNFKDVPNRYGTADTDLPILVREGGKYYINDGTHRIAAQVDNGARTIRAQIIDLDSLEPRAQGFGGGKPPPKGPPSTKANGLSNGPSTITRAVTGGAVGAAVGSLAGDAQAQEELSGKISQTEQTIAGINKALADFDKADAFEKQRILKEAGYYPGKIDGNIAGQSTEGIAQWKAQKAAEIAKAEADLTELVRRDAYQKNQPNAAMEGLREYGPTVVGVAAALGLKFMRGSAAKKSVIEAAAGSKNLNRLITKGPVTGMLNKADESRPANLNTLWQKGGAGKDELPFKQNSVGKWMPNPKAKPAEELFSENGVWQTITKYVKGKDIALILGGGADAAIAQPLIDKANRDLAEAEAEWKANPSVETFKRVEDAKNALMGYTLLQRLGYGIAGGRILGTIGAGYAKPRPNIPLAATEQAALKQFIAASKAPPKPRGPRQQLAPPPSGGNGKP